MSETDDRSQPDPDRSDSSSAPAPEEEILRAAGHMLGEGRALVRDYLDLLAVEGQLAGRSLVLMLALAVALGLVLVSTWIFLNLAGVMWLVESEFMNTFQALLISAGAHAALALLIWFAVRHLSRNLVFSGFRKVLEHNGCARDGASSS